MSAEHLPPAPDWWVMPNTSDWYSTVALICLFLGVWGLVHLYARFDRHAEAKAEGTPLRTTIPTLLTIALAYELLPMLDHFSMLLPLTLILTAIARDFMMWWKPDHEESEK